MKTRKLHLKNIGPFDDEEIAFQPCPAKNKAEIHILTGPNGSGKSTILLALASAFYDDKNAVYRHQTNLLRKRFRYFETLFDGGTKSQIDIQFRENANACISGLRNNHLKFENYRGAASYYSNYLQLLSAEEKPLDELTFAAFAYSGYRYIQASDVDAVADFKENPLAGSLVFIKNPDKSGRFTVNQWIANSLFKSAYEERRNGAKAAKFARALKSFESAISEIVGYQVTFESQTDPLLLVIKANGQELDFDVLPDGLRSLISWMGDLLMRVDSLKWQDELPAFEKNLILFLDEIEVHLHPAWQRKVLPVVQKLFKNSQIFISTHSPFVVNSIDDAWVYKLELDDKGKAKIAQPIRSEDGYSYSYVLSEIFDIKEDFGVGVQKDLAKFKELRNKILTSDNSFQKTARELLRVAKKLAVQSEDLQTIIQFELRQINKRTGKKLVI